jgi:hypothetical protein
MKHKVGETITLTVILPGSDNEQDVSLTLAKRPAGR